MKRRQRPDEHQRAAHQRLLDLLDEQLASNPHKARRLQYALRNKPEDLRQLAVRLEAARARITARQSVNTGSV